MNKKILRTLTALCAALMLSGGFSVTAFAQTPEGEDDTNDSGVVYEEPQKEEPLTPDGNATLVDDFGGNKQLITVTTKNGNYFYILIDRDDEGENTVHFLNQVDEADLLALMEDGSTEAAPPAVCSCTDKCEAGKVNVSCPVCKDNMTACSGKEAEPETEKPTEQPKEKGNTGGLVLFLVVALLGGGGAFYYFKFMKSYTGFRVLFFFSVTLNLICTVLFRPSIASLLSFPFRGFGTLPNKPFSTDAPQRGRAKIRKWVPASYACYECFYPLCPYPLLRRKSYFAKLPQKKNAAIQKRLQRFLNPVQF